MVIKYIRTFILLALTCIISYNAFSDEIKVSFKKNPKSLYTAKSFLKGNEKYISVMDFVQLLSIKHVTAKSGARIDLLLSKGTVRLEAGSPFVHIKQKSTGKVSVEQISARSLSDDNELYVPIDFLIKNYIRYSNIKPEYNSKTNTLTIPSEINLPVIKKSSSAGSALTISRKANGYTIKIPVKSKCKISHKYYKKENLIEIKFMTGDLNLKFAEKTPGNEIIEKTIFKNHPSSSELKLFLNQDIESSDIFYSERNKELYVLLFKKFNVDSLFKTERRKKTIDNNLDKKRRKWELNNIIIDPGHGGKDPGCIGITKKYEKNVVLSIALKLGKLIEKKTNIKVHYTRKNDTFIPLYRRGQIANEKKGNLFISIHCNSNPTRNVNISGFEAFILRPGKTEEAIAVAELENSVIKYEEGYKERYKHLSDENFILTAMAQNAYVKFSESFAEKLCSNVKKNLPLKNNGVLQAGFYVLVGASMPSVLVETGYLSNKKDEAFLNSASGQQKLAESIFGSILSYREEYEKSLKEGK
jgi:N-acetylmuramoyl-L-alanine amidase